MIGPSGLAIFLLLSLLKGCSCNGQLPVPVKESQRQPVESALPVRECTVIVSLNMSVAGDVREDGGDDDGLRCQLLLWRLSHSLQLPTFACHLGESIGDVGLRRAATAYIKIG